MQALTIALGILLEKTFATKQISAVVPIILGAIMAFFGDILCTKIGFNYACLASLLAALKVVASNEVLTGNLKLHPIELLSHMAPLAMMQCLFLSCITGETASIASRWSTEFNPFNNNNNSPHPLFITLISGVFSFLLKMRSLTTNKLTSLLTMHIVANIKQVLIVVMSTILFQTITPILNRFGIMLVLLGGTLHIYVCFVENSNKKIMDSSKNNNDNDKNAQVAESKVQ